MEEDDEINLLLAWTDHQEVLTRVMSTLRHKEVFADVTLICGEKHYAVHKFVLCTCSPYFEKLLESTPCDHPVLVLTETPPEAVEALLDFMYLGKADLSPDDLDQLLDVAYEFKIRGLINPKYDPERQAMVSALQNEHTNQFKEHIFEYFGYPLGFFHKRVECYYGGVPWPLPQIMEQTKEEEQEAVESIVEGSSVVDMPESTPSQEMENATEQEQEAVKSDVEESLVVDMPENTPSQSNHEKKRSNGRKVSSTSQMKEQASFSGTFGRHVYKRFKRKSLKKLDLLDAHMVSHIEARLLSCPECPYRTMNKATLSKHIIKHMKAKPYACPYCPARHSLEQQHITHQKQVHPKMKVIINESAAVNVRKAYHRKHKRSDEPSEEGLISSPPSKVRRCSGSRFSPSPALAEREDIRTSPSPSPTAKVLNSPKSSASSSPSEVHEFTITSPSPPPEWPRSARSNFSSSPPSKVQSVSGMILSSSPPPKQARKSRSSSSTSPPPKGRRVGELNWSPSPPPKLPKHTRSSSSSSPPSKYMKARKLCISPSSPLESRSVSSSSSYSNISPDYSPTPSPTPPKSLRTTRSSTLAESLRRRSREK